MQRTNLAIGKRLVIDHSNHWRPPVWLQELPDRFAHRHGSPLESVTETAAPGCVVQAPGLDDESDRIVGRERLKERADRAFQVLANGPASNRVEDEAALQRARAAEPSAQRFSICGTRPSLATVGPQVGNDVDRHRHPRSAEYLDVPGARNQDPVESVEDCRPGRRNAVQLKNCVAVETTSRGALALEPVGVVLGHRVHQNDVVVDRAIAQRLEVRLGPGARLVRIEPKAKTRAGKHGSPSQ